MEKINKDNLKREVLILIIDFCKKLKFDELKLLDSKAIQRATESVTREILYFKELNEETTTSGCTTQEIENE